MTIQGAIAELKNLLEVDDIPFYYKAAIKKVIETIQMEMVDSKTEPQNGYQTFNGTSVYVSRFEDELQTERPCDNCQEWDCYGCDYEQTERSE